MKSSLRLYSSKDKKVTETGPASPDSPEAGYLSTDATILEAINALRTDLQATKVEICQTIDTCIEEVTTTIRGELSAFKTETQSAIQALQSSSDQHVATITELERTATQSSDAITTLHTEVNRLRTEVNQLTEKCMDLEGRSRQQNVRIAMLKEGAEKGTEINTFVSRLLKDVLSLEEAPLVHHAHRALRRRPDDTEPLGALVVRLHYFCDVMAVLRRAVSLKDLFYHGQRIRIFPDFTPKVAKHRAAFNGVRELLRDKPGVRYGLLYPCKVESDFQRQGDSVHRREESPGVCRASFWCRQRGCRGSHSRHWCKC